MLFDSFLLCVCVCVCVRVRMRVRVCVCHFRPVCSTIVVVIAHGVLYIHCMDINLMSGWNSLC